MYNLNSHYFLCETQRIVASFAFYSTVVFNHKVHKELHKDSQRKNLINFLCETQRIVAKFKNRDDYFFLKSKIVNQCS